MFGVKSFIFIKNKDYNFKVKKMKKNDLQNSSVKAVFWKYTLPSIAMMLIMSVYFIVDGMFVGKGIGSDALGAVNLCIPILMALNTITMALSIGASIVISIRLGRQEYAQANNVFSLLFWINMILVVILSTIGLMFLDEIAYLLGANEDTVVYATKYLSIIFYFMPFFTLQNTLSSVVRNDGNPNLSLVASVSSSLINIPLDYVLIFILNWGITGAAVATGFSQVLASLILITHFLFKKGHLRFIMPKFDAPLFKQQIINSVPVFISNISMPIIMFIMNLLSSRYYGMIGLSAYAIIGSISMFVMMIFFGMAQGIQPIISYNVGTNNTDRIKTTLKMGIFYSTLIALIISALIALFPEFLINLYITDNPDLLKLSVQALLIFMSGFVFEGANLLLVTYFQSIENNKMALLISIARTFVVMTLVALLLPVFFGAVAVWLVVPVTEVLVLLGIGIFYFKQDKQYVLNQAQSN